MAESSRLQGIPVLAESLNNWLEGYENRTDISLTTFVIAGAGALIITLCTVRFQTIKAAIANPVKSLRSE